MDARTPAFSSQPRQLSQREALAKSLAQAALAKKDLLLESLAQRDFSALPWPLRQLLARETARGQLSRAALAQPASLARARSRDSQKPGASR